LIQYSPAIYSKLLFYDQTPEWETGKEHDYASQVDELMTIFALFIEREKAAKQGESSDLAERVR
jgi:hypothetical protein